MVGGFRQTPQAGYIPMATVRAIPTEAGSEAAATGAGLTHVCSSQC